MSLIIFSALLSRILETSNARAPTGIVIRRVWRAGLACDLADALNDAFGLVGAYLPWGKVEALAAAWQAAGDPSAILARVLATDNPHGEPPPNPCPTCGHVKETP